MDRGERDIVSGGAGHGYRSGGQEDSVIENCLRVLEADALDFRGARLSKGTRVLCDPLDCCVFAEDTPANQERFRRNEYTWRDESRQWVWFPPVAGLSPQFLARTGRLESYRNDFQSSTLTNLTGDSAAASPPARPMKVSLKSPTTGSLGLVDHHDLTRPLVAALLSETHCGVPPEVTRPGEWIRFVHSLNFAWYFLLRWNGRPVKNLDKARDWGIQPGGGILLFGPPGTGKTTFARAVAGELDVPFFYASGAQIRSKWYGESEKKLRQFIRTASSHPVAVLFFDDLDGLFSRRSSSSAVDNRLVIQFLAEKGGFEESKNVLLLLGATNRPWEIDEAVFRTGRFDMKLYIGLPDPTAREALIRKSLGEIPLAADVQVEPLVARTDGYTGSDIVALVHTGKRAAFKRAIAGGLDKLTAEDLDRAFQSIPKSVTPELMAKYQEFNEKRF